MRWRLLLACLWLAGCGSAPISPSSTWGPVLTIGSAEQGNAPALVSTADRIVAAWVGADESGVHHDIRAVLSQTLTPTVVLPLPPRHPIDQSLSIAPDESTHLLWLDSGREGTLSLYNALIDESLGVFRGPVEIAPAQCYATTSNEDRSLWVIWQGGNPAEPDLFAGYIDSGGRLRGFERIVQNAGCPAVTEERLFWTRNQQLFRADFLGGRIDSPQMIAAAPAIQPGDRIESFFAAHDAQVAYIFWNITRVTGEQETWLTSGPDWPTPRRLFLSHETDGAFETGFNTGTTFAAEESTGGIPLQWAAPLNQPSDPLPVAMQVGEDTLGIVYFSGGVIVGYQPVTQTVGLLAPPILRTDRTRHLTLGWSERTPISAAQLRIASTRPLPID